MSLTVTFQTTNQSDAWASFDQANQVRIDQWNTLGGQFNVSSNSSSSARSKRRTAKKSVKPASMSTISGMEVVTLLGYDSMGTD